MTWLDRKLEEFEEDRRRDADIKAHAPALFTAVWDQIKIIVDEATGRGFVLRPNGDSERRSLDFTGGPTYIHRPMRAELITLSLSQNRHVLEVSGLMGNASLAFQISPCPDNLICLHFDGNQKTPEECAQIIMGRFLFGR